MTEIKITHHRICITKTTYKKACPYCKKRPLKRKTCGDLECQYNHHILTMRARPRKTDRKDTVRTIKLNIPS